MDTKLIDWIIGTYCEEKKEEWDKDHVNHGIPSQVVAFSEDGHPEMVVAITGDRAALEAALAGVARATTYGVAFVTDAYTVTGQGIEDAEAWQRGSMEEAFKDPTHPNHSLVSECINAWVLTRDGFATIITRPYYASATSFRWLEEHNTEISSGDGTGTEALPSIARPALAGPRVSDILTNEDAELVNWEGMLAMGHHLRSLGLSAAIFVPEDKVEAVMERAKARGIGGN